MQNIHLCFSSYLSLVHSTFHYPFLSCRLFHKYTSVGKMEGAMLALQRVLKLSGWKDYILSYVDLVVHKVIFARRFRTCDGIVWGVLVVCVIYFPIYFNFCTHFLNIPNHISLLGYEFNASLRAIRRNRTSCTYEIARKQIVFF